MNNNSFLLYDNNYHLHVFLEITMDLNHFIYTELPKISRLIVMTLLIASPFNNVMAKEKEIAQYFTLPSKSTGKSYQVSIYVPKQVVPQTGYSIIYLLDGHLTFPIAQKIANRLLQQKKIKPIIIVGIDYQESDQWITLRAQDYTPPHNLLITDDPLIKGEKNGGGAAYFLTFINTELKPFIEQQYPINREQQALFGHSYGGLFTLYSYFVKQDSFQYYYAASPSIWWDNKVIMQIANQFIHQSITSLSPPQLIISVGGLEQTALNNSSEERKQKLIKRRQVDNAKELVNLLNASANKKLSTELILFPNENHGTVIPLAIESALTHFFKNTH